MTIFDRAIFSDLEDVPGQGSLFPQVAKLSEQFFPQLADHSVPLEEAAVRAISNNSMALDLYAWLAYRLHVLKAPTPVSWTALKGQFGAGFDLGGCEFQAPQKCLRLIKVYAINFIP
jgi:hypothetical protein